MVLRAAVPLLLAACAAAPGSPDAAPTAIDLRPQFLARGLPPRHQGSRPTCSIFTTVAAIEYALAAYAEVEGAKLRLRALVGNAARGQFVEAEAEGPQADAERIAADVVAQLKLRGALRLLAA